MKNGVRTERGTSQAHSSMGRSGAPRLLLYEKGITRVEAAQLHRNEQRNQPLLRYPPGTIDSRAPSPVDEGWDRLLLKQTTTPRVPVASCVISSNCRKQASRCFKKHITIRLGRRTWSFWGGMKWARGKPDRNVMKNHTPNDHHVEV